MHQTLEIRGRRLTNFWHCFGTERHRADFDTVLGLLAVSGTNVLPINTHRLDARRDRSALEHGFAGVGYDDVAAARDVGDYVKMLNINLRTSTSAAVEATKIALDMTGELVLKLEVLDTALRTSQDFAVVAAAEQLIAWNPDFVVLPLLSNDLEAARAAVEAGCPLLRIMGSRIGSRRGVVDHETFSEICRLGVPVVLDGGVGQVEHLREAASLGAAGALVNSVLFDDGRPPVTVMTDYAQAAVGAFSTVGAGR